MKQKPLYLVTSSKGIILSYKPFIVCEALIVSKDRVLAYGDREALESIGDRLDTQHIHYDQTIIPGFIDAHLHIDSLGFELSSINLLEARDRSSLLEKLRGLKPNVGEWIVGGRFDHLVFPDQMPPRRIDIDKVVSTYPVLLIHRSGHMGVLNTRGLEYVRKWISGGEGIDYENGWVYESTLWTIRRVINEELTIDGRIQLLRRADEYLYRYGVTGVGVAGCSFSCLEALKKLSLDIGLKTRIYVYMHIDHLSDLGRVVEESINLSIENNRLRVNGIKILLDGALGPRTAYLSKPYNDDPSNRGLLLHGFKELSMIVREASRYGLQVAIHAIGDEALDYVLKAYGEVGDLVNVLRHRIEHASLVRDDQLRVLEKLRPVIVVQPHFILTDTWILDRVGIERINWVYRFKSISNITHIAFSTDAPVEPVNPWETIYAAITRGEREGLKHGIMTQNEKLELLEALHMYTRGAGYALRDDRLGCLLPGCYPDMLVVDKNPLEINDPSELLSIEASPIELA